MAISHTHVMFRSNAIVRVRSVPLIPCIGIGIILIPESVSIFCMDGVVIGIVVSDAEDPRLVNISIRYTGSFQKKVPSFVLLISRLP